LGGGSKKRVKEEVKNYFQSRFQEKEEVRDKLDEISFKSIWRRGMVSWGLCLWRKR